MDIISIVNTMQPNTIAKLALHAADFPNGEPSIPFMGVFVQLFPGAVLPDPAAVIAYQPTYDANILDAQAAAAAKASLPDIETQMANLTAFAVSGTPIPAAQIAAANNKLSALGQPVIATDAVIATNIKAG